MKGKIVVDASVVAKWFVEEELSNKAVKIRDLHVRGDVSLKAPKLLVYELGNVFWKHPLKTPEDGKQDLKTLLNLDLKLAEITPKLFAETLKNTKQLNISFYDSTYLTLAQNEKCPLVTADTKLAEKAKNIIKTLSLEET